MTKLWKKIDKAQQFPIRLDRNTDECFFAREYVSRGGYTASECNNLIINFKKKNNKKGLPEWAHKIRAISQFARELAGAFNNRPFTVATIPTSKVKTDPNYDSRFEDMLLELTKLNALTIVEEPIELANSTKSASTEAGTRNTDIIYNSLVWKGFKNPPPDVLIVIDDVITTGGHFAAYKRMLLENHPNTRVIGMFWALTVWNDEDEDEDEDEDDSLV